MISETTIMARMLTQVQQWEGMQDRRAIFLNCYALMTQNMFAALGEGRFRDPAWVVRLLSRFSDYYFAALEAYERQDTAIPTVWQLAHDAAAQSHLFSAQHLFLGVNAHINYDLALTVVELLGPIWPTLSPEQRQLYQQDFDHVNVIIKETTDQVQDEVLERHDRIMAWMDLVSGPLDEWFIGWLITGWRDEVWQRAVAMMACADAAAQESLRLELEKASLVRGRRILLNFATA